ncbi:MAG TPA: ABC transporter permease [Pyrinomonadaceae bacterium]|nr:ABC transporter permease [Pyrinomonadaceae bacterium]
MLQAKEPTRFRFWLWLIRLIGVIVPQRLRADWKQEWEAELQHREQLLAQWDRLDWRSKLDLLRRSASSFWDALWLLPKRWEDEIIQDLRFGLRLLLKNRGFTVVAVLSLALGIGANTAIFSLVDAVLIKSLPVKSPEHLVAFDSQNSRGEQSNFSHPVFKELRSRTPGFSGIFAAMDGTTRLEMTGSRSLAGMGHAEVQLVSGEYFQVLGVNPIIGRTLTAGDDQTPGAHPVAVLSYDFWQGRFAGDVSVIGQTITLKEQPFTVIGVTPPGFFGEAVGRSPDIWAPLMMEPSLNRGTSYLNDVTTGWLRIMARLQPDVSEKQAQAALTLSLEQIKSEQSALSKAARHIATIQVLSGRKGLSDFRTEFAQPLKILMAVVGLVLLIACANVANLLLARSMSRQNELAVRLAIGAGRFRLIRQFLSESLLLAAAGGVLGLLFARWGSRALLVLGSQGNTPLPINVTPDIRIFGFTLAVSLITAILFGLAPALIVTRGEVNASLKGSASPRRRLPLFRPLVVGQVALSLLLLTGAALLVQTLRNLHRLDLGFAGDRIIQARIYPESSGYEAKELPELHRRLLEKLNSTPGLHSVSLASSGFRTGTSRTCCIAVEGYTPEPKEDREVQTLRVTPGYFATMGLPLVMGRDFTESEVSTKPQESPKAAIINVTMARHYFGDVNPLGRRFGWGDQQVKYDYEIVGVAGDANYGNLRVKARSLIYYPGRGDSLLVIRAATDSTALIATVRQAIQQVDKGLEILSIKTVPQLIDQALVQERLLAKLSSFFSLLALLLACVGLYGVMAYDVARRTREIGIRMALGAQRRAVVGLIMHQTMWLVIIGVVIGLGAALISTRWLRSLLFGLTPNDPLTILLSSLLLVTVAGIAGYLPARKAAQVDPLTALRHE